MFFTLALATKSTVCLAERRSSTLRHGKVGADLINGTVAQNMLPSVRNRKSFLLLRVYGSR
jgi:hypothetical protein